eukprot:659228-Rhodomonas_salina.1
MEQQKHVARALKLIPNTTTLMNCLLQRGVQSAAVKEAVAAAAGNAKTLETDHTALLNSERMFKAATSSTITLTAT